MYLQQISETTDIKATFDRCAEIYGRDRATLVPCFEEFYGTVIRVIPFEREESFNALDLGAGTGLLSALVGKTFPNATITLTDLSEPMLNKAKERFTGQNRFSFKVMKHQSLEARSEYDLVVSALSIHHLEDEQKQLLFNQIYAALSPRGLFVNTDQVLAPSAEAEARYEQFWREDVMRQGATEQVVSGSSSLVVARPISGKGKVTHPLA
jgi:tRNA (cmo5U34)-methyltransferase